MKKLIVVALTAATLFFSSGASALGQHPFEPGPGSMLVDAVLVRPLGVVGTVIGAVGFVVSLPFSALGGNVGEAAEALVKRPAKFTFLRPLGHNTNK